MVPLASARTMNSEVRFFISARFCAASAITSWHEAQCLAYRSPPSGAAAFATTVGQKTRMIYEKGRWTLPNDINSSCVPLLLSEDALLRHPVFEAQWPIRGGQSTMYHTEAVAASEIDVQLGGHFRLHQRQVKADAVLRRDRRVATGLDKKRRRRVGGDVKFLWQRRISQDEKIGTAADTLDGIGRRALTLVPTHSRARPQVPACREAHHSDAASVEMPLLSPCADYPESALSILKRRLHGIAHTLAARQPVLQHKSSDADRIEPLCNIVAFLIDGQVFVAPARAQNNPNAGVF